MKDMDFTWIVREDGLVHYICPQCNCGDAIHEEVFSGSGQIEDCTYCNEEIVLFDPES
jgi:hypothetical protein